MSESTPKGGSTPPEPGFSRRGFLKGAGISVAATGLPADGLLNPADSGYEDVVIHDAAPREIELHINGSNRTLKASPSTTLLEALRLKLDLTGAKRVCDRGACGACTVHVDGRPANACSLLAFDMVGRKLTTVEGLDQQGRLTPLQQNFIKHDALQCGFCTPGMVMSCTALLAKNPSPSRDEIQNGICGNICRCGTYQNIFEAVEATAKGDHR